MYKKKNYINIIIYLISIIGFFTLGVILFFIYRKNKSKYNITPNVKFNIKKMNISGGPNMRGVPRDFTVSKKKYIPPHTEETEENYQPNNRRPFNILDYIRQEKKQDVQEQHMPIIDKFDMKFPILPGIVIQNIFNSTKYRDFYNKKISILKKFKLIESDGSISYVDPNYKKNESDYIAEGDDGIILQTREPDKIMKINKKDISEVEFKNECIYYYNVMNLNIFPKVYECNYDYIVMDKINGEELSKKKNKEQYTKQILANIIKLYLQGNNIHKDLHDENIIVDDKGKVIFIDAQLVKASYKTAVKLWLIKPNDWEKPHWELPRGINFISKISSIFDQNYNNPLYKNPFRYTLMYTFMKLLDNFKTDNFKTEDIFRQKLRQFYDNYIV